LLSVLLPESKISRSGAGLLTTRVRTVKGAIVQRGGPERHLRAVEVHVVPRAILGEPVLEQ
jgi:hypothetical protein